MQDQVLWSFSLEPWPKASSVDPVPSVNVVRAAGNGFAPSRRTGCTNYRPLTYSNGFSRENVAVLAAFQVFDCPGWILVVKFQP